MILRASRPAPAPTGDTPWDHLRRAGQAAWASQPDDVRALLRRDGLNIPFGPLMTAESYLRVTHETLWRVWLDAREQDRATRAAIARTTLELAVARVDGYCHMQETGAVLQAAIACLGDPALPLDDVLAEALLYCARMSGWLDLCVPWWRANELAKQSLDFIRT